MENVETIILEDQKEYIITDELEIGKVKYVYLTNEEDISKIVIRKINNINNEEYLVGLDTEEEFQKALSKYIEKHR